MKTTRCEQASGDRDGMVSFGMQPDRGVGMHETVRDEQTSGNRDGTTCIEDRPKDQECSAQDRVVHLRATSCELMHRCASRLHDEFACQKGTVSIPSI
ncbi:MAG: hypothetical protein ACKPKO_19545, partial [Candidatus Fonsibacter sp.]